MWEAKFDHSPMKRPSQIAELWRGLKFIECEKRRISKSVNLYPSSLMIAHTKKSRLILAKEPVQTGDD